MQAVCIPIPMQVAPIPKQEDPVIQFPEPLLKDEKDIIDVQPQPTPAKPISPPPTPPPLPPVSSPLDELSLVDRLFITKRLRVKTVLFLRGKKNRFFVMTPDQRLVYKVEEENRWWVGYFCYGLRPLQLKVTNNEGEEIMTVDRPYACTARVLPCHLQRLKVFAPPGNAVGTVEQVWTPLKPRYVVKNREGESVFFINGPCLTLSFFNNVRFCITRADGTPVGGTFMRWQGLTHALFFSPITHKFGIAFDLELSVEEKALLLAATLLLDYMYYDA